MGSSGSLIDISGSTVIHNTLTLGGYTNVSSSLTTAINSVGTLSGSAHTRRESLSGSIATTQGAQDTRLVALESFTGSLDATYATDAQVNTISQSVKTYADAAVSTESSSLAPLYRAEINTVSSSAHTHRETQIAPLNTFTGSIQTEVDGLSAVTSSYETSGSVAADYISIEKLKTFITGSYAEFQTAIGSL